MSLPVALVLASAFLHALWNALLRRHGDSRSTTAAVLCAVTVLSTLGVATAPSPWFASSSAVAWALASGLCEAGYFVTLGRALHTATVGAVYPVSRGGALLVAWPISVALLGERLSWIGAAGAALVGAGLFAISFRRPERGVRDGLRWAMASAVFVGAYSLIYKQALLAGAEPRALFSLSMLVALPLNLFWLREGLPRIWATLRAHSATVAIAGAVSCASFWLYLFALKQGGAGALLTLRNTSVVFAQLFAWILGERPTRRQLAGAAVVVAGAMLLGLA